MDDKNKSLQSIDPLSKMENFITFNYKYISKLTPGYMYTPSNSPSQVTNDIKIVEKNLNTTTIMNTCKCNSSKYINNLIVNDSVYEDFYVEDGLFLKNYCNESHCVKRVSTFYGDKVNRKMEIFYKNDIIGFGVKTLEPILKGSIIGEYVGVYSIDKVNPNSKYLFTFSNANMEIFIDGELKGNFTRFINHSCEPNAYYIEVNHNNWEGSRQKFNKQSILSTSDKYYQYIPQLWLIAKRYINPNEEICINYGDEFFNTDDNKCCCGTATCIRNKGFYGGRNNFIQHNNLPNPIYGYPSSLYKE
uniref:SET domain-containing protein n=1 Tax=Parastrongyloides trichosuri TaxID=131310 RepID=A0A0N4ZPT7_PARTI